LISALEAQNVTIRFETLLSISTCAATSRRSRCSACAATRSLQQGLTTVHFSAQLERFFMG
jgi:hypothetical protein